MFCVIAPEEDEDQLIVSTINTLVSKIVVEQVSVRLAPSICLSAGLSLTSTGGWAAVDRERDGM